jgi:tetratricopeptide (TPR) repeat protein
LREKLGESLSSIEKYGVPIEYITTSSLEALKFFTLATEQVNTGKTLESIPFYKKALEIDDKFSSVYMGLAVIYANTGQMKLAAETTIRAFKLRDTASENEKLRIEYFYYSFVTGEIDKAIGTLDLWRKTYPSHISAVANLSDLLERTGQSEKAVFAAREGLRIDTNHAIVYMNLAESLLSVDRYAEVKETCQKAFEKKFDGDLFHHLLYIVAFIERNAAAMAEHVAWFSGRADEYLALDLQTGTAGFQGQWRKAQDSARRAIDLASRSEAIEVAAQYAAEQALRIVFWSSGTGLPKGDESQLKTVLKTQTNKALNLERGKDVMMRAALALAVGGQTAEADSLTNELHNERPKDTLLNQLWLPLIRAASLLQQGKAKEAIEELEVAERFEKAGEFYPQYLQGSAYLKLNKPKNAVKEFDKILNNRGEAPLSSIYPLAQLGKARAMRDKAEYEKFFELWKEADKDMPALIEAKKEYENLN